MRFKLLEKGFEGVELGFSLSYKELKHSVEESQYLHLFFSFSLSYKELKQQHKDPNSNTECLF